MKHKIIYGIEFEIEPSQHNKATLSSENFTMMFIAFDSGKSMLNVVFSNPTTSFNVQRNTIEQTFFDFFSMMPNAIKDNQFDNISNTFFENYKKELDGNFHRRTFGKPLNFDDFDKNLPDIEHIKFLPFDICPLK